MDSQKFDASQIEVRSRTVKLFNREEFFQAVGLHNGSVRRVCVARGERRKKNRQSADATAHPGTRFLDLGRKPG